MNSLTFPVLPTINKPAETGLYLPVISMILPFEPKMVPTPEIVEQLKAALATVHRQVARRHQNDLSALVMQKLRKVVRNLNFTTYTKSIAIFVSPLLEKVLYLDTAVEARIAVDDPLDIRTVVFAKKQSRQYLLLHITDCSSNIYFGNEHNLTKIKSNIPSSDVAQFVAAPKVEDPSEQRLKNIICSAEQGLAALSQAYPLPVFVVGSRKAVDCFTLNTSIQPGILQYACSNDDITSIQTLEGIMKPIVDDWDKLKKKYLLEQIECAKNSQLLAMGIGNVWRMASKWSRSLLIVEENYRHAEELLESEEGLYTSKEPYTRYSHIRNTVDFIIESVLENGGDVEFVEKGLLQNFKEIALVRKEPTYNGFLY